MVFERHGFARTQLKERKLCLATIFQQSVKFSMLILLKLLYPLSVVVQKWIVIRVTSLGKWLRFNV